MFSLPHRVRRVCGGEAGTRTSEVGLAEASALELDKRTLRERGEHFGAVDQHPCAALLERLVALLEDQLQEVFNTNIVNSNQRREL